MYRDWQQWRHTGQHTNSVSKQSIENVQKHSLKCYLPRGNNNVRTYILLLQHAAINKTLSSKNACSILLTFSFPGYLLHTSVKCMSLEISHRLIITEMWNNISTLYVILLTSLMLCIQYLNDKTEAASWALCFLRLHISSCLIMFLLINNIHKAKVTNIISSNHYLNSPN